MLDFVREQVREPYFKFYLPEHYSVKGTLLIAVLTLELPSKSLLLFANVTCQLQSKI